MCGYLKSVFNKTGPFQVIILACGEGAGLLEIDQIRLGIEYNMVIKK